MMLLIIYYINSTAADKEGWADLINKEQRIAYCLSIFSYLQ